MPKARWPGLDVDTIDDWDRDSQIKRYAGPTPPDGVYIWCIKYLKKLSGTRNKNPQLRVGLELVPREGSDYKGEHRYKGYFTMDFIPVANNTAFRYVPLLDVLGVSGRDFVENMQTDDDGNVRKIGKWVNKGQTLVAAELVTGEDEKGNPRKEVRGGAYFEVPEDMELPEDDEDGENAITDDYVEDDEPRRSGRKRSTVASRKTSRRRGTRTGGSRTTRSRRRQDDDDDDGF